MTEKAIARDSAIASRRGFNLVFGRRVPEDARWRSLSLRLTRDRNAAAKGLVQVSLSLPRLAHKIEAGVADP